MRRTSLVSRTFRRKIMRVRAERSQKCFRFLPDSAAAYLFTARLLLRLDFAPVAEEYGKKAIELDAKLPLAHQVLGELYLYENKLSEATTQFEQEIAD